MSHHWDYTGRDAELRWGYHTAARLSSFSISTSPTGGALTGTVTTADAFAVTQRPLTFVVTRPNGVQWTWPVESLWVEGSSLSGVLTLPKE